MQIEVKPKEGKREILTIFVEEVPWRDVHTAIFGRHPTFPICSSHGEWVSAFETLEYKRAKNYVIWRLTSQNYHSQQLSKLLRERLVPPALIAKLIEDCQKWGYLNDEAWIKAFLDGHQKRQGLRAILAKLKVKGLRPEDLQQVREQWMEPQEEKKAILHLIQTRYRSKDLTQYAEKQKVFAALMRKGYAFDLIRAVLGSCQTAEYFDARDIP